MSEYIEISGPDGQLLADGLEYIKQHPRPPPELWEEKSSPRPQNMPLPEGWGASEVDIRDAHYQGGSQSLFETVPSSWSGGEPAYGYADESSGSAVPTTVETPMTVDASWKWVQVKRVKVKHNRCRYDCELEDGSSLSFGDDWELKDMILDGQPCRGYVNQGKPGTTYYTFSLAAS